MKHIAIWGYGQEGRASHRQLGQVYPEAHFTLIDTTQQGLCLCETEVDETLLKTFDMIVKSPGVSLYKPDIQKAIALGIHVTTGTNLWFETYSDAKTIIVTGTKGKSTTTSLIHHMLKNQGFDVALAGNIGVPLLETKPAKDWTIIELSSYQIADLKHAPDIAVLLNLYPEHTDWHGSVEQYYEDKLRLLTLSDKTVCFTNENIEREIIKLDSYPLDSIAPLKGDHNLYNVSVALSVCTHVGAKHDQCIKSLNTYEILPHRLEEIGEKDGVLYVDDSISTIPEATIEALKIYNGRPITLIMGGMDRGQDYEELITTIENTSVTHVCLLPENGRALSHIVEGKLCDTLEDAVHTAQKTTPSGGVILLSPAAPSYGQFKNFKDRGQRFRALYES